MPIPLYSVLGSQEEISKIKDVAVRVIESSQYILGEEVLKFEAKWAQYCGYNCAVGVNSGTSALEAVIRSYNLSQGSKFIVPVNTYSATAMAVCNAGCTPVFVDCNESYGMDMEQVKEIVENNNISGIIPVHLYGIPESILQINRIAEKHGLVVFEDAAQAHGLVVPCTNDKVYSFYPTKNLGAIGDGGAVVTNNKDRALWIEKWRNQGRKTGDTVNHEIVGTNSRLDAIQAAVLNAKLDHLDAWNKRRCNNALLYNDFLSDSSAVLPTLNGVFHLYVVRIKNRDRVLKRLRERSIGCSVHYPTPLHLQTAFKHLGYKEGDFPVAEKLSSEIISLPMHPYLGYDEIKIACYCVKKLLGGHPR